MPAALGVVAADPSRMVVGLSGDYDFQFMIEELAVGAQFNLPYVQVLVNNSYLGLIRQAQRGFDMDYCVQLAFENQNVSDPALQGYGVDHVQVIQGLGCKAIRVTDPGKLRASLLEAQALARKHRVPVVVEVILERVTNIAMGTGSTTSSSSRTSIAAIRKAPRAWPRPACWPSAVRSRPAPRTAAFRSRHLASVRVPCPAMPRT